MAQMARYIDDRPDLPEGRQVDRTKLPLLAAGPVFAECDGVPDEVQIKGGDGADGDGPDQLRIREDQVVPEVSVATEASGDQTKDQIQGGEGADHEGPSPDRLRTGQTTE